MSEGWKRGRGKRGEEGGDLRAREEGEAREWSKGRGSERAVGRRCGQDGRDKGRGDRTDGIDPFQLTKSA